MGGVHSIENLPIKLLQNIVNKTNIRLFEVEFYLELFSSSEELGNKLRDEKLQKYFDDNSISHEIKRNLIEYFFNYLYKNSFPLPRVSELIKCLYVTIDRISC